VSQRKEDTGAPNKKAVLSQRLPHDAQSTIPYEEDAGAPNERRAGERDQPEDGCHVTLARCPAVQRSLRGQPELVARRGQCSESGRAGGVQLWHGDEVPDEYRREEERLEWVKHQPIPLYDLNGLMFDVPLDRKRIVSGTKSNLEETWDHENTAYTMNLNSLAQDRRRWKLVTRQAMDTNGR